jgi:hypothetical protein
MLTTSRMASAALSTRRDDMRGFRFRVRGSVQGVQGFFTAAR